jgi:hypothetical protein
MRFQCHFQCQKLKNYIEIVFHSETRIPKGRLHLRFGCAVWMRVSLSNAFSKSFLVSKTNDIITHATVKRTSKLHIQNASVIDPLFLIPSSDRLIHYRFRIVHVERSDERWFEAIVASSQSCASQRFCLKIEAGELVHLHDLQVHALIYHSVPRPVGRLFNLIIPADNGWRMERLLL